MMKHLHTNIIALAVAVLPLAGVAAAPRDSGRPQTANVRMGMMGDKMHVELDLVLDSMHLKSEHQLFVTPVLTGQHGYERVLPSLLVSGRNMHYAYQRGSLPKEMFENYPLFTEVMRRNGRPQSESYSASVPLERWMLLGPMSVVLEYDTCGCGHPKGKGPRTEPLITGNLNPAPKMRHAYITPEVTEQPVRVHEGKARVQFEVDRTDLHEQPYRDKTGRIIDNRAELKVIYDSVTYALTDPNVEIADIKIVGYASPESPYLHNQDLATGRSRALAEHLAEHYRLPADRTSYDAVPENWVEFREQVVKSDKLTEQQRRDLLELIDAPAYGPSDYDAKENTLKTDPKFAKLYRDMIHPDWFPRLRATKFAISTRLKPLSDEKLAEVIEKTPQLMSLNQMMRVARLYQEGSKEFNRVIDIALEYYPDDPVANLNAAVAALDRDDLGAAAEYLQKAGNSPEAENARGVLATYLGNFDEAAEYFDKAGNLPEAVKNKAMLPEPISVEVEAVDRKPRRR